MLRWLKSPPLIVKRLIFTLVGVGIPLGVALLVNDSFVEGDPAFAVSVLSGILGFHLQSLVWANKPTARTQA